jgi:6-phosphogluconate dehydrogenase
MSADIGLIGLAVMGENLVLNFESRGFTVAVHNRTTSKIDDFVNGRGKGKKFIGCHTVDALCKAVKKPRKIMLMVQAGAPVDKCIEGLLPHLEAGDIIIDGGNSHFPDTSRRVKALQEKGILFVGAGVSGGEEGALKGPSIMPGGASKAWEHVKPLFQAICARADGAPCCDWVGEEGSGHFVKMVHNGIEYGDMQLISEAYHVMKSVLHLSNEELHKVFSDWNKGELDSFLIEVTADIFTRKDELAPGTYVVDNVLDTAGQKGTGKWTVSSALDFGMPVTLIGEAVFARCLSAMKEERVAASKVYAPPPVQFDVAQKQKLIDALRDALYASKIVSYAQGFILMRAAAAEFKWHLNYGGIALMWRGGCIIRSAFLGKIKEAFDTNPNLGNLLLAPYFQERVAKAQANWRFVAATAVTNGIPIPAISTALAYFDGFRTEKLPANLLQATRDYFGAHTFERIDKPRGQFFHCNWTGHGGSTASSTYNV